MSSRGILVQLSSFSNNVISKNNFVMYEQIWHKRCSLISIFFKIFYYAKIIKALVKKMTFAKSKCTNALNLNVHTNALNIIKICLK